MPAFVLVAEVMVRAAVPDVLIVAGVRVELNPLTSEMPSDVRLTLPLKLNGVTVKLKVA